MGSEDPSVSVTSVARQHSIDRSTLLKWMRNRDDLLKVHQKSSSVRRVSGGGQHALYSETVHKGLLQFVEGRCSDYLPVTTRMLYYEWLKLEPRAGELSKSAAKGRIY
eukprot:scaffold6915_cov170-Amphora_coffeaeformis.AAC.5